MRFTSLTRLSLGAAANGGSRVGRVARAALFLGLSTAVLSAGCSAGSDDGSCIGYNCSSSSSSGGTKKVPQGTEEELKSQAEILFRGMQTELVDACGRGCHDTASKDPGAPKWLSQPDPYVAIRQNTNIVVADYPSSLILTKGQHNGPPLDGLTALNTKVVTWLRYEAAAISKTVALSSDAIAVANGPIEIPIGALDKTGVLKDAKLTATVTISGTILELSNLLLVAPAGVQGAHLVNPRFIQMKADGSVGVPDVADSFSNVDQTVATGTSAPLGTGTVFFTGWTWGAGDKLRLEAKKLEDAKPSTIGQVPKCKNATMFQTQLMPLLMGQMGSDRTCTAANCHGNAQKSPDMAPANNKQVAAVTAAEADAFCSNLLAYINKTTPANSAVIMKPAGATAHNGGKLANAAAYTTAWTTAIQSGNIF